MQQDGTATPTSPTTAPGTQPPTQTAGSEYLPPWLGDLVPTFASSPAWSFLVVILVTAVGFVLSKYVIRLLGRPVAKRFRRQSVAQTVLRLVRLSVVFFFFLVGATLVGLRLGDIVLSVTVFSAVLGIVLAPIVGSIINGLFVLADRPYEIGDMVELQDGARGFVDDITLRYTKVFTLDNTIIVVSNDAIREQEVTNYSAEDERTRLTLSVMVTYESDVDRARDRIEAAAADCEGVIEGGPDIRIGSARYPAGPASYIDELADDGILLTLRYWVSRPYKLLTMRSRVQTRVWDEFADDPDVEIAYPHRHLIFDDTSGEAAVAMREAAGGPAPDGVADAIDEDSDLGSDEGGADDDLDDTSAHEGSADDAPVDPDGVDVADDDASNGPDH